MTSITQYQQQVATQKDAYLGFLAWYTCTDVKVSHQALVQGLQTAGLHSAIPSVPADVDVFRRVSTNAERKKVATSIADTFDNYLIRPTDESDPITVRRMIVKERVNKTGKRLTYDNGQGTGTAELYYIDFHRDVSRIAYGPMDGGFQDTVCEEICKTIVADFWAWRGCLNSYAIREMVRRILLGMGATMVRDGGGVYFVSHEHQATLTALETFVSGLPGGSTFHSLPLIDDQKQRDMIRRAYEAESTDAVDRMLGEISEIKTSGKKISPDKYAAMVTKFQELTSKTKDYETVLQDSLRATNSRLTIFQRSIFDLRSSVKEG